MNYYIWVTLFYLLGSLYLVDWFLAQSRIPKNEKWLMFTPIWFFFPKSFGENGKRICTRVQIYFLAAIILFTIWKLGFVIE